jgi:hypothetical protein
MLAEGDREENAMQYRMVRIAAAMAAAMVLGGCVGYGFPGQYGDPYGNGNQQPYPGGYAGQTFRCESQDGRMRRCSVDTRYGVRLSRRLSDSPCVQGRSWGYDNSGVWVSNGCRAEFVTGDGYGPQYPGGGDGQARTVRCESQDNRMRRCSTRVSRSVQIQRKLSDSPCIQGSTWGWDRQGIWVDRGCRADFLVY